MNTIQDDVDSVVDKMPDKHRAVFFGEFEKRMKDPDTFTVLIYVFGGLGIHQLYLGNKREALIHFLCGFLGMLFVIMGLILQFVFILPGLVLLLADIYLWVRDLVKHKYIVGKANNRIKKDIIKEIKDSK
ncbi:MAG TPA: TM2 domain-containing protein [Firmicutes bacterium]|nr:TM2 domain-containing protein [Bacillota bacterium]